MLLYILYLEQNREKWIFLLHLKICNHKPLYIWKWLYKTIVCSTAFDMKNILLKTFHLHFEFYLELTPFRILSQTDKHGIVRWNGTTFIENRRVAGNSGTLSLPIGWLSLIISSKGPQSLVFLVEFLPTIIFPHLHIQIFLFFISPTVVSFPLLHSVYYLPLRHICFLPKCGGQGQPFQCWHLKIC